MQAIYFDHNATTPILPEAADAVREAALGCGANPESQHEPGRQARRALEAARQRIGEILGAGADDPVIFTSGGTEANNLAIAGLLSRGQVGVGDDSARRRCVLISSLEHPSVYRTAESLASAGYRVERLPAGRDGVTAADGLAERLNGGACMVSVMLASHETGVLQPVAEIAAACRACGVPVHTDATQVVGKLPVSFRDLGVDALTCAAHKFHGPVGIGALVVRRDVALAPSQFGGFQQGGARPGTENVALALGMLAALEAWARDADARRERMTALRDDFERRVLAGDVRAVAIGAAAPRLPHTSNLAFVGLDRQALAMALDLAGVACSTGSACASGSSEPSPALVAMGLPDDQISASIRFSIGATTTPADVDEGVRRILSVVNRLRRE